VRDPATVRLGWACSITASRLVLRFKLSAAVPAILALLAPCGQARGAYTVIAESGPASNRVNVVFLGDGYTADQIETTYVSHINSVLDHMFDAAEDPFARYANFFNVYRVNVISQESGADVPPLGIFRDTALGASYCWEGGPERLLFVEANKAKLVLDAALAGSSIRSRINLVTVNDARYGGAADGMFAVFAGANDRTPDLALHEMGHTFSHLADEYDDTDPNILSTYTGEEPAEVNVTVSPTGEKWSRWLGYDQGSLGLVGAYEGARYFDKGLYRPSDTSKMRELNKPFNAVCREKIIHDIYSAVAPVDSYTEGGDEEQPLVDPQDLRVDLVDPDILSVNWYVNRKLVPGADDEFFSLADFGYGPGSYLVNARAFDPTDWVRDSRGDLEQWVQWYVLLTPEPSSAAMLLLGALAILRRRRRRTTALSHCPV
jgi:hypothetical protein